MEKTIILWKNFLKCKFLLHFACIGEAMRSLTEYPKLKDYFLDYDREKMKGTFESICSVCDECGSKFIKAKSKMMSLCPECAHILYGYENCNHQFKDGKCELCHWDGSRSDYIKKLVENNK